MLTLRLSVVLVGTAMLAACGTAPVNKPQVATAPTNTTNQQWVLEQQRQQQLNAQRHAQQLRAQEQQQEQALRLLREQRAREQYAAQAQQRQQQQIAQQRQRQQQLARQRQIEQQRQQQIATPPAIRSYEPPAPARQTPPSSAGQVQYASSRMYTGAGRFNRLPDAVASNLRLRGISESGMGAYVRSASGNQPALLTANADAPRNPASTMKLVTTYAGLGILGPDYRWPTELYTVGNINGGVLYGDVIIKGYGDPMFAEQDFRQMLQALKRRGIHTIRGNLVADISFFNVPYQHPGAFDGNAAAAYNAQPEAILYQERGGCYEFKDLKGKIQKVCPVMPTNAKARQDLNTNIFGSFWKLWVGELRGQMTGSFVRAGTPGNAQLIYTHRSRPLREVITEINKDSNNVMARQILLSIGAKQMGAPGTPEKGAISVGRWLASRGLNFPELRIENGSGLSRVERISSRHLGEMLVDAYNSPYRNEFMNSLAVLGVDGTLKNRMKNSNLAGRGRFKTGTLRDVRALAGYVQASHGETYVVSILHNDSRARTNAREAHDDLVEWVYWGPRNNFAGL